MKILNAIIILIVNLRVYKAQSNMENCSRFNSRIARNVVNKLIIPAYKELNVNIPAECAWNPSRDAFLPHEEAKSMLSSMDWECQLCGKRFYSEDSLDNHFIRKHDSIKYKGKDGVCLADLCPILRCDVLSPSYNAIFWEKALCKESEMAKLRSQCREVLKKCIPLNEKNSKKLSEWLEKSVCGYISCENHWEKPDLVKQRIPTYILVFGILAIMFVIAYYVIMCLHCSDNHPTQRPPIKLSSDDYSWKFQNHPGESDIRRRVIPN